MVNTVTYTNLYDATALLLVKEFEGAGADQFGLDRTFTFTATCTFAGETVLDTQVELNAENGWTTAVHEVIPGSECSVVEDDLNGADAVVIEPNDGENTSVGTGIVPVDGGIVTVTATNWYLTGSLEVGKEADVIAVDPAYIAPVPEVEDDDPADVASRLIFRSHPDMVRAAWVRGRRLEGPGTRG